MQFERLAAKPHRPVEGRKRTEHGLIEYRGFQQPNLAFRNRRRQRPANRRVQFDPAARPNRRIGRNERDDFVQIDDASYCELASSNLLVEGQAAADIESGIANGNGGLIHDERTVFIAHDDIAVGVQR